MLREVKLHRMEKYINYTGAISERNHHLIEIVNRAASNNLKEVKRRDLYGRIYAIND